MKKIGLCLLAAGKTLTACSLVLVYSTFRPWVYANQAIDTRSRHLICGVSLGIVVLLIWDLRVTP